MEAPTWGKDFGTGLGMQGGARADRPGGREPRPGRPGALAASLRAHQASLAPRRCKAAGSWPTATHGLRDPVPCPLALFDRGSGLQKKEARVQGQDGMWCRAWRDVACVCKRCWGKVARMEPGLGRCPAWGQSGPRGVQPESSKTCVGHSVGCHHVACSCARHEAQAQVGRQEPDVMAPRCQHLLGL